MKQFERKHTQRNIREIVEQLRKEREGGNLIYIQESIHEQIRCAVCKWKTVTQHQRKYTINET
jgi:hypothetical protein